MHDEGCIVRMELMKLGLCPCGGSAMKPGVPLGKEYKVARCSVEKQQFTCQHCERKQTVDSIMTLDEDDNDAFRLPLAMLGPAIPLDHEEAVN